MSIRDFFQKHYKKSYRPHTFEEQCIKKMYILKMHFNIYKMPGLDVCENLSNDVKKQMLYQFEGSDSLAINHI